MNVNEENESSDKVISLFDARAKLAKQSKDASDEKEEPEEKYSFEDLVRKNKEATDRMQKDRAKANRSVLRSYRLKT